MSTIRVKITRVGQPNRGKVVTLDLEDYIIGVVSSEMSNKWPPHALMAQAVTVRTYAMAHLRSGAAYDVDDTVKFQAYRYRKPGACPNVEQAVKATAGLTLTYDGKLISAVYSASNGGVIRSSLERWKSDVPYLRSKADPWDKATGLPRLGHGVGMSQRGAKYAATHGYTWRDILGFYYPGCLLDGEQDAPSLEPVPPMPTIPDTINQGDHGELVIKLQQLLVTKGAKLKVDGIFGAETRTAVRAFQRKRGLDTDGIAGPKTWAALLA